MPEPTTGTPAPDNNPQGTVQQPQQPQTTPQTPAATPAAQPTQPAATTPPAQPDVAALQKKLEQAEQTAKYMQSEKDRALAQIRALTGAQTPQADPMVGRIKAYTDQGYTEQDARFFISQIDQAVAPIMQQNQQLQAAVQGQSLAQQAYHRAVEQNPELFADPKVQQAAWGALSEAALAGQNQFVTPDYALSFAAQTWALENQPWKKPANGTPPPVAQPQFRPAGPMVSFAGPVPGYPQPAPQPTGLAPTPQATALAAEMAKYTGVPLTQPNQQ